MQLESRKGGPGGDVIIVCEHHNDCNEDFFTAVDRELPSRAQSLSKATLFSAPVLQLEAPAPKMSNAANTQICTYYLKNACNRGNACTYKHQNPPLSIKKVSSEQVCKYFLEGTCAYGSKCKRSHQKTPQSPSSTAKSSPKTPNQEKKVSTKKQKEAAPIVEETREPEPAKPSPAAVETSASPCGLVRKETHSDTMKGTTIPSTAEDQSEVATAGAASRPSIPCKHFLKGKCAKGDSCRFIHESSVQSPNEEELPEGPVKVETPAEEIDPKDSDHMVEDAVVQKAEDDNSSETSSSSGTTTPGSSPVVPTEETSMEDEPPQVESSNGSLFGDDPWGNSAPEDEGQQQLSSENDEEDGDDTEINRSRDVDSQEQEQYPESISPKRPSSWYGDGWPQDEASSPFPEESVKQRNLENTFEQPPPTQTIHGEPIYPHISQVVPHWSQFADPYADPNVHFCKAHTRGVCTQGDYCKFRHSLTPAEYTLLFGDEQPNLWTMRRDPPSGVQAAPVSTNEAYAPVTNAVAADAMVVASAHAPKPFRGVECAFYSLGKCKNGADCPYMHTKHPPAPDSAHNGWGSNQDDAAPKHQTVCRFFKERGTCARGMYCKFRHDTGDHPEETGNDYNGHDGGQNGNGFEDSGNNNVTEETPDLNSWGNHQGWDDEWGSNKVDPEAWSNNVTSSSNDWSQPTAYRSSSYQGGRRNICYQFEAGNCHRGDSCRFSHDDGSGKRGDWPGEAETDAPSWPTDYPAGQKPPCALYKRGNCHRGVSCSLSHEDPEANEGSRGASTREPDVDYTSGGDNEPLSSTFEANDYHADNNEPSTVAAEGFDEGPVMHTTSLEEGPDDVQQDEDENFEEENRVISPLPPVVFNHPETKRTIMNSEVMVGPDTMPLSIKTRAETTKLRLTNLSVDSAPSEISALARQYGTVLSCLSPDQTFDSLTVDIEFAEPEQAYRAYKNLDNTEFGGIVISASLPIKHGPFTRGQNDSFSLKVSWPRAAVTAWVHYPTISKAKHEETRLNGVIVKGRSVKASFVSPSKSQKTSFSVNLANLPTETTKADLDEMCPDNVLVTLNVPVYTDDPTEQIKRLCGSHGKLKLFDVHQPKTLGTIQTAFVTYADEVSATSALDALAQLQKLEFLGGQQLQSVQAIHYISYRIAEPLFTALEPGLEGLKSKYKECTLQYGESSTKRGDATHYIRTYAPKDEHGPFADLNKEVWELLKGTMLESGGRVWNDYFEIPSSSKALRTIQEATKTYIYRDDRERCIRVYGTPKNQEGAISQITKLLTKVDARRHLVMVDRPKLRPLMSGGYKKLQDTLGANQVTLDAFAATLIVRGSSTDLAKAKKILTSLPEGEPPVLPIDLDRACAICHLKAVDPILLSCRHAYCTSCLKFGITHNDTAPYGCIAPRDGDITLRCASFVPYVLMNDLLTPNESKKVLFNSFLTHVRADISLFFCPTPNCQATHRVREDGVNVLCTGALYDTVAWTCITIKFGGHSNEIKTLMTLRENLKNKRPCAHGLLLLRTYLNNLLKTIQGRLRRPRGKGATRILAAVQTELSDGVDNRNTGSRMGGRVGSDVARSGVHRSVLIFQSVIETALFNYFSAPPQNALRIFDRHPIRPSSAQTSVMSRNANKKPVGFATHIIAGGIAGGCEANVAQQLVCQPLDTIKVRMQLSKSGRAPGTKARGFLATGAYIMKRETPLALYKGLGAVLSGIVPKMAIRFASFEAYKEWLADKETGKTSIGNIFIGTRSMTSPRGIFDQSFLAGLGAGVTEAVAVVTPMEVVKIRLQAQQHSLADPLEAPRYRNAGHAVYTIVREEGFSALYRGANFTAYQEIKKFAHKMQPDLVDLPSYQHMIIGLISGAMGPFSNAPIDTIKTRLQKATALPGQSALQRIAAIAADMWKTEGVKSFYKGITPRVLRVAPGQAIVFAVYERVSGIIEKVTPKEVEEDSYSE
ncbi:hypothetical protein D9619_006687 [Psilocybe cf. subviscida]|uniref:Mitochondrial carrier n=1 Tax=Psilocybe cf. subviscida TaxID=2480587 RepID=A0A8H5B5D6_9AGAR|nr:hypothetical protein D9619_006687 [Psilocybe cf. subviscida]